MATKETIIAVRNEHGAQIASKLISGDISDVKNVPENLPKPRPSGPLKVGLVPAEKVMVCCIVENKPHAYVYEPDDNGTETRRLRPLEHMERAVIDSDVAEVLERNKHAIRL